MFQKRSQSILVLLEIRELLLSPEYTIKCVCHNVSIVLATIEKQ